MPRHLVGIYGLFGVFFMLGACNDTLPDLGGEPQADAQASDGQASDGQASDAQTQDAQTQDADPADGALGDAAVSDAAVSDAVVIDMPAEAGTKEVDCGGSPDKPSNAVDVIEKVTVTYDAGSWTEPSLCEWVCADTHTLSQDEQACINEKQAECSPDPNKPANSQDVIVEVTVRWISASQSWQTATCAWACVADHISEDGQTCIQSKNVPCALMAVPEQAVSTFATVQVVYSDANGWSAPTDCSWTCATGFVLHHTKTLCVRPLLLFSTPTGMNGDLNGRDGVDKRCQTLVDTNPDLKDLNIRAHALLSVDANDDLRNMPLAYGFDAQRPLVSLSRTKVANSWGELLDGNIETTLQKAEVLATGRWWSGSKPDGSAYHTCLGWTSSASNQWGTTGFADQTDNTWVTTNDYFYCHNTSARLVCIAYDASPTVLFNFGVTGGDLGGRAGADQSCRKEMESRSIDRTHARAFIGVNTNDQLLEMPFNYLLPTQRPFVSHKGEVIQDDWSRLLTQGLYESLSKLDVTPYIWWSGSDKNGKVVETCRGWTSASTLEIGRRGSPLYTDSRWLDYQTYNCSTRINILCAAFNP
ncbi:MAG: hypothetical protein JRH20_31960 [Deltaproteobacteria bacterium]|nr:hypothetical protein [Deltaproteobacteria bacterium]